MILLLCLGSWVGVLVTSQVHSDNQNVFFRLRDGFWYRFDNPTSPLTPPSSLHPEWKNPKNQISGFLLIFSIFSLRMEARWRGRGEVGLSNRYQKPSLSLKNTFWWSECTWDVTSTPTQLPKQSNKIMIFWLLAQIWRTFLEPKPPKKINHLKNEKNPATIFQEKRIGCRSSENGLSYDTCSQGGSPNLKVHDTKDLVYENGWSTHVFRVA